MINKNPLQYHPIVKVRVNPNWLPADMQAHIKLPPIPLATPE